MTSGIGDQYLCRVCLLISAKFGPGRCYHHHQPSPTGALLENKNCRRLKLNWKCMCGVDTIYCPAAHILFNYSGSGQKYSWRLQMASQKPRWTKEGLKRIKSSSLGDGPLGGWAWLLAITLSVCTRCMFIANTKWSTVVLNNRAVLHGDDNNTT